MRKTTNAENRKPFENKWLPRRITATAFLAAMFSLLPLAIHAQSPPVVWSRQIAGPYQTSQNAGLALDGQDNFYYAANFGPRTFLIGNQTLTNRSAYANSWGENGFIAKFSKSGDFLWVQQIGGTWSDGPAGCATDAGGNVFVTGAFASSNVVFGGTVLTNTMPDVASCFLAKYDSQGDLLWAQQSSYGDVSEPGGTTVMGLSIAVDAGDNVWLAGTFDSSNVVFGTNMLVNAGYSASTPVTRDFLVKYNSAGGVLWAQTITVNDGVFSSPAIALDANGNAFYSGVFSGIAGLGTTVVTNVAGDSPGALLAKFDPDGNILWAGDAAYPATSGGGLYPNAVAVDSQGNCRIEGYYYGSSAVFPSNTLPAPATTGEIDGFVAKFDASGNFLWADVTTANQYNANVSVDAIGNSYVVGFNGISKYASDGTLLWSH